MTRTGERTAVAAVAVALGAGSLSRQFGGPPMPPGLVQLFGPVAGHAARYAFDGLRRWLFVFIIILAPWWGAAALSAADSMPAFEDHMELPSASLTILAPAAALLWAVRDEGIQAEPTSARRTSEGRRDPRCRWFALSTTRIKPGRGAHVGAPGARGGPHDLA